MRRDAAASPAQATPDEKPERLKARHAKKLMLEMLRKYPIVEAACAKVGISRSTHYEWIKKDLRYRAEVEEAMRASLDTVNDIAESNIIEGIKKGDHKSSTFWLMHRHSAYRKSGESAEQTKTQKLYLKPPPSKEHVAAIRKYDPGYQPPKQPEYITQEEWEQSQRAGKLIEQRLEEIYSAQAKKKAESPNRGLIRLKLPGRRGAPDE